MRITMTTKLPPFVDNSNVFRKSEIPKASKPVNAAAPRESLVTKYDHESIMDHLEEVPQVLGFRVLLIPVSHKEMTKGGILLPDEVRNKQMNHAQIFRVVGMGPSAYKDEARFPDGPYCEIGDYVFIGRYAGTRITTMYCDDLRVLNDDEIMARVPDVDSTLDII
jgi:co-chaperonin GroES (HSP10)